MSDSQPNGDLVDEIARLSKRMAIAQVALQRGLHIRLLHGVVLPPVRESLDRVDALIEDAVRAGFETTTVEVSQALSDGLAKLFASLDTIPDDISSITE